MKRLLIHPLLFVVLITLIIICSYIFNWSCVKDFFNNQTIAVLIGFIGIYIGYLAWHENHKRTLLDKYFDEIVSIAFSLIAEIYEMQLSLKRKEKISTHELVTIIGNLESKVLILETLSKNQTAIKELKKFEKQINTYIAEFKKLREKTTTPKEFEDVRAKAREYIKDFAKNNRRIIV